MSKKKSSQNVDAEKEKEPGEQHTKYFTTPLWFIRLKTKSARWNE